MGYQILLGGLPKLKDVHEDHDMDSAVLIKRILLLLRKERVNEGALSVYVSAKLILTFASVFPLLLEDVNRGMKEWGTEGKMNPFNELYDVSLHLSRFHMFIIDLIIQLVFQLTVRMASCRELSENREAIALLSKNYWEIEKNGTPVTVLFPWFPSFAKRAKKRATKVLCDTFLAYINLRRKSSTPSNDPIDLYLSQGLSDNEIIEVRPS